MNTVPPVSTTPNPAPSLERPAKGYSGRVVYLYAYDLAYDMTSPKPVNLLGQRLAEFSMDASKRSPRQLFLHKPRMIRLPPLERLGPHGTVRIERTVKLLPVGAISIAVSVPFAVPHIEDLVAYHDLKFSIGSLTDEVTRLAGDILNELRPYYVRPVRQLTDDEAYTVFCLDWPVFSPEGAPVRAEVWFKSHRRQVAALLTQEPHIDLLSRQESEESTARYLSYYEQDVVVLDWDAALVMDRPGQFDEALYILELANLQLAELEAYDRILDDALERSYRDLAANQPQGRGPKLKEIRELRVDMARFSDELMNITKFFGDWHLARIYAAISARFHLSDWHRTIEDKLKTLDDLYEILKHDQINRWMMILEVTIVVLFVIDLVILMVMWK